MHAATLKGCPHSTTHRGTRDASHGVDGLLKDTPTAAAQLVICIGGANTSHSLVLFFRLAVFLLLLLCCFSQRFRLLHLKDGPASASQQEMMVTQTGSTSEEEHLQILKGSTTLCFGEMVCDGG